MNRLALAIRAFFSTLRQPRTDEQTPQLASGSPSPLDFRKQGAAQALGLLQRGGRLVDFLNEDLSAYSDEQIGAAVREIHRNCHQVILEHFPLRPILDGAEGDVVSVPENLSAPSIRWSGLSAGDPPKSGILQHHGWQLTQVLLPELSDAADPMVVAPAQLEVSPS